MSTFISLIALFVAVASMAAQFCTNDAIKGLGAVRAAAVRYHQRKLVSWILWTLILFVLCAVFLVPSMPEIIAGEKVELYRSDEIACVFFTLGGFAGLVVLWHASRMAWVLGSNVRYREAY